MILRQNTSALMTMTTYVQHLVHEDGTVPETLRKV